MNQNVFVVIVIVAILISILAESRIISALCAIILGVSFYATFVFKKDDK